MLIINSVEVKNFLSCGQNPQRVVLNETTLTLILGENLDNGNSNASGKSSILQAVSYGLFGKPLSNIKIDNLINKINAKGMVVKVEFEVKNKKYTIERGRKPNILKWYVNNNLLEEETDESQGENRHTQEEIEKIIGMSHTLFRHIVALNTKTIPFLSLRAAEQRELIEELLGITQLSRKADVLKELVKETKDNIKLEEIKIKHINDSNEKIQKHINDLQFSSNQWEKSHKEKLNKLKEDLSNKDSLDVEAELKAHADKEVWKNESKRQNEIIEQRISLQKNIKVGQNQINALVEKIEKTTNDLEKINQQTCPLCNQSTHTINHDTIKKDLEDKLQSYNENILIVDTNLTNDKKTLEESLQQEIKQSSPPTCFYKTIAEVYEHKNKIELLRKDIENQELLVNPYIEQIQNLSISGLQEVDMNKLEECIKAKDHQEFLLKLLVSKDSFIRKKIIDQNLSFLNTRMIHYLEALALPHEVTFMNDLSVSITHYGREYDFEQLSGGEGNRLVLALSWSFRDIFEHLNHNINLLMIDEIVDTGMDSQGMDAALTILKKLAREKSKNIFLISHKDELQARVDNILTVQKENGFTTFMEH